MEIIRLDYNCYSIVVLGNLNFRHIHEFISYCHHYYYYYLGILRLY